MAQANEGCSASPPPSRPPWTVFLSLAALALALYCALDPLGQGSMANFPGFETYFVDLPPMSSLPQDHDHADLLARADTKLYGEVQGPESVAFDAQGRGPYAGVADGRVLRWDGARWVYFAHASPNRSHTCDLKPSVLSYLKSEHICGRPLGLRFHKETGELYIADAYFGLMKVGPDGGLATPLTTEAEGLSFNFTNDLDIDDRGNVYFTDSSTNYQRRNFLQLVFTSEPSGRLLKYDPATKETTVLLRNLMFPNGVSLSKDGSFLVLCEGSLGRLTRYWLAGEKAGTSETFATLPGFPDNVRTNDHGEFWVAIHARRSLYAHICARHPRLRKVLLKLPIPAKFHYMSLIGFQFHAMAMKFSADGQLLQVLEDKQGKVVRIISEVEERGGKLYIGSVLMSFLAVYQI